MKLYYTESVCSLAVRIIIHELGLFCDYEAVDLKTKLTENHDNFLSINAKGSVPVLVLDDKRLLTENAVILQYLVEQYDAPQLLPPVGDYRRYEVLEWLNYVGTDLHRFTAPLFWSSIPVEIKQNLFIPKLMIKLSVVNQHLENNLYLMHHDFTIADSYLFIILVWLAKLQFDMSALPFLKRYFNELSLRPSIRKALEEEHLLHLKM